MRNYLSVDQLVSFGGTGGTKILDPYVTKEELCLEFEQRYPCLRVRVHHLQVLLHFSQRYSHLHLPAQSRGGILPASNRQWMHQSCGKTHLTHYLLWNCLN